jgi:poly(hydroxyalkanoate) granule-associated protein
MASTKRTTKKRASDKNVAEQLEDAFLAGLGALSNAQKAGEKTFESLVKQGEQFRKKTTKRTESLINNVQNAIRDMTGDAQSKATGLLDQVRDKSNLSKLQGAFDTRVADAMDRLNVPSKNDIDKINKKLNKIVKLLEEKPQSPARKSAAKKAKPARKAAKKATAKKVSKKKVSKVTKKAA